MVDVGPTTPQQANEFDPNGYWSPASQRPNPTNLQYTMDGASSGTGGAAGATPGVTGKSNLAFSADTFVPGGGKQAAAVTAPTYDALGMGPELQGMNQGAVEFVPGGVGDAGSPHASPPPSSPLSSSSTPFHSTHVLPLPLLY